MTTDLTPTQDHDTPHARLRRVGLDALSDTELVAIVLGSGRAPTSELAAARALLATHQGLRGVSRTAIGPLARDVGERRAARLVAAVEIARRAGAVPLTRTAPYRSSRDVVRAFGARLVDASDERVLAVVLDARQRPVAERMLACGTASACAVGARQVFALAVREGGAGVLMVHNHPSGDPTPSAEDIRFTRMLVTAGALLEVPLVDHVIVGREGSFSFLDAGLLARPEAAP